jgi:CARDB
MTCFGQSRGHQRPRRIVLRIFLPSLLITIAPSAPAQEAPPPEWTPSFAWEAGKLVTKALDLPESCPPVVDLINSGQFDEALTALDTIQGENADRLRADLAFAVAGHLDVYDPEPALAIGEKAIRRAVEGHPEDVSILRLLNQIELYRAVPWFGLPPDTAILPARDLIAAGDVEGGRKKLAETAKRDRIVMATWVVASFFQRRDDLSILLDDAEKACTEAGVDDLLKLIQQHRQHPWASLSVQPDSLLYPRVILERMRSYYWWWRQMGESYRPMSKQGFLELLAEIEALFPMNDLVRMYKGEKVPWGEGFRLDPVPKGAPGWAVNQRELRARVDHIVEWWFDNRQDPNGELGGGWEDDCETLRRWAVSSICCGNPKIEAGIAKLVDGIWTSGELVNGYDRVFKDVEHSSEMSADTSVMIALAYGDPLYFERFMETTRTTLDVHTGVNDRGHRHFRSMKMSATEVGESERQAVDALYCGRAMRPAAMVAWYSNIPLATKLVHDWAMAWSEDTFRAGKGKPAGIMPATVRFADGDMEGPSGQWWSPGLGDLYLWRAGNQDMVLGKILGAWMLTGDRALLAGPVAQFTLLQRAAANPPDNPEAGSADWAGAQLASESKRLIGMYHAYTGDTQFDDVLMTRAGGYPRFMSNGDVTAVEKAHAGSLNNMRVNLPMVTSEVRGTDRVALDPDSLLGPLTGSPVSITEPPAYAVTWRGVNPDFTALVRGFDSTSLSTWIYSFADAPPSPTARLWRLDPGKYELRCGPDLDADGKVDGAYQQTIPFECRERLVEVGFNLPPRQLWLLDVLQIESLPSRPVWAPDLAVMPRDITVEGTPGVGTPCLVKVTVHNIGSADASGVMVTLNAAGAKVGQTERDGLSYPFDLKAKTAVAEFSWTPEGTGEATLTARVGTRNGMPEIYSGNNTAELTMNVE